MSADLNCPRCHGIGYFKPASRSLGRGLLCTCRIRNGKISVASQSLKLCKGDPVSIVGECEACSALAKADKRIADLEEALGWFCGADDRFRVAVGGNPNVVDRMVVEAQARYARAAATEPKLCSARAENEECARLCSYEAARFKDNAEKEQLGSRGREFWINGARIWQEAADIIRDRFSSPTAAGIGGPGA